MRTDTNKDWTEAFRESFPEEVRPADRGWEAVAGRLRRAAARRRAAIAAAVLALPLAGGLFFFIRPDGGEPLIEVRETPGLVAQVPGQSAGLPDAPPANSNIAPENSGTANGTASPSEAGSGREIAADEPAVLSEAGSGHDSAMDGPSVPSETHPAHGGASNVPAVPVETAPDYIDADFSTVEEASPARKARRLTVGLSAASMADGAHTAATVSGPAGSLATKSSNLASNNFLQNSKGMIMQKEYVHDLPLSFGLNARYRLSDRLSVESGVEYSYLHSRLDDIHTVMHFAGIPLRVDYSLFTSGPVEFYAGVGGKAEKCLKASLGGMRVKERGLQWSGSFNVGARYRLSKNAWVYFQPDISYYFTRTNLTSYRTENRLGLNLRAGVLFDINH